MAARVGVRRSDVLLSIDLLITKGGGWGVYSVLPGGKRKVRLLIIVYY